MLRIFIKALIWHGIIFQTRLFCPLFEQDARPAQLNEVKFRRSASAVRDRFAVIRIWPGVAIAKSGR
jgi:hypothetical protein